MIYTECENEQCKEPHGQPYYVVTDEDNAVDCLYCFLVWKKGMDPEEVADICFEGGKR